MRKIVLPVAVACLLCSLMAGCGSKVSQSNYDKITNGMTQAQVEEILGKGTENASGAGTIGNMTGSGKIMTWTDGNKTITVVFANDKVTTKSQKGL